MWCDPWGPLRSGFGAVFDPGAGVGVVPRPWKRVERELTPGLPG